MFCISLKNLANKIEQIDFKAAGGIDITEVEDSFDAPMMIMNQIHEA